MAAPRERPGPRSAPSLRGLPGTDRAAEFGRWKAQCLGRADLSRKGSVDEGAAGLVQLLNGREQYFTTSSCAGRIVLLDGGINGFEVQKQNCCWLLVTHKPCVKDDVIAALKKANGDAILKFEPLVLHVQCRQLQDAQILHSVAIDSGFRNSGITVGKRGKTMLAVRSTHGLEVPLSHKGKLMVTEEYIDFLLKIANQKMEENKKRIERFYNCLQHALEKETITNSHAKEKIKDKNNSSYTHKKKRNPEAACGKCITEENAKECENDDDPGMSVTIFPEDY
ncbi:tRNA wybutosine-synthesizing protein 3 homolog [Lycaon pictus]|uniref:tRNA wybutosine-synthesizing protein 3 homolog n=2 Tax=Canis lupus familiaris TaxID=9615 RepID=A0A8C0NPX5_CANLF|nr:tRNA wybutosine-synthesizing protein 3 homolog [Canis lupus familiaris]XP_038526323.1 tRNA wybutosine-synthesizing protein 3 homolog [Canis lupus familiaris]